MIPRGEYAPFRFLFGSFLSVLTGSDSFTMSSASQGLITDISLFIDPNTAGDTAIDLSLVTATRQTVIAAYDAPPPYNAQGIGLLGSGLSIPIYQNETLQVTFAASFAANGYYHVAGVLYSVQARA